MLTREDDIDVHALRRQGWTISAIARHLGRDRKTIRAYLAGREAGVRARSSPDPFELFAAYCGQRLRMTRTFGPRRCSTSLLELGYDRSYPTMTRALRARGLRPACEPCVPTKGRAVAVIEHPPGEETQWDWVELPDPPAPPDRRPSPGRRRLGRAEPGLALRPDGHRGHPGNGEGVQPCPPRRGTWPWAWPARPPRPATAPTSPPPRTWPPAATGPPSKDAGPPHAPLRRPHLPRHRRAGLPRATRRRSLSPVPGHHPALHQDLDHHHHHQPPDHLLGSNPG